MALLDTIKEMKSSGYQDQDIINRLQSQGISPREINEAMAQMKIREAVEGGRMENAGNESREEEYMQGMQPSMTDQVPYPPQTQDQFTPQYPRRYSMETEQIPEFPSQDQQTQQYQEEYGQFQQQYPQTNQQYEYQSSTENMVDLIDQIVAEKLSKTNKVMTDLQESRILIESRVEKIDQRLQRIESIIDQIQTSILRRSSQQSQDLDDIKSEMHAMQTGFSKILNPLTDQIRDSESHHSHHTHHKKKASSKKRK